MAQVGGTFRAIDLTEASTRAAAFAATSIVALYEIDVSMDYIS